MTLAWHFTTLDRRLAFGDGRLVVPGETLTHEGPLKGCRLGLHASRTIADAILYAPGPYLWRVRLGGHVIQTGDRLVASTRTALWGFDATDLLQRFVRRCALAMAHTWDVPEVLTRYLRTGDEALREEAKNAAVAAWYDPDFPRKAWRARGIAEIAAGDTDAHIAAFEAVVHTVPDPRRRLAAMVGAEARRRGLTGDDR